MNKHFNITNINDCTACYKCVKQCPTNSISIVNNIVSENNSSCIHCGTCSAVCEKIHLKKQSPVTINTILNNNKIVLLLDSTVFIDKPDITYNTLRNILLTIGFSDVDTTFKGIAVKQHIEKYEQNQGNHYFYNDCIPFNRYVQSKYPHLIDNLFPYKSSQEISAQLKKEELDDIKVMLVSNCYGVHSLINECNTSTIDYCITIEELEKFIQYKNIDINNVPQKKTRKSEPKIELLSLFKNNSVNGIDNIDNYLSCLSKYPTPLTQPIHFSLCSNNCFGLPNSYKTSNAFEVEKQYIDYISKNFIFKKTLPKENYSQLERFKQGYSIIENKKKKHTQKEINNVLNTIGVNVSSHEYNCRACGYNACREFAESVLDNRADIHHCPVYLNKLNEIQSKNLQKMLEELKEAFSLTIPDHRLEHKLKTTPLYSGRYDTSNDYYEITDVIEEGLYTHIINCLKLTASLKNCNVFKLIGLDKNLMVQTILYHCNAKSQPILQIGDVVKYSEFFEDKKEEALRSATFAKEYYDIEDDTYYLIKYHKHSEDELPENFPKSILPAFRLFKVVDAISAEMSKSPNAFTIEFEFIGFILYIRKTTPSGQCEHIVDLYRKHNFCDFEMFIKDR